ncbi:MAG: polysaccharide biosynthesis C-terminal domain-containing protein, partial [Oscillospiraceae bacterium]|nr:polysaccharide biosynthesis C-terminal domain-containing protein [Oscillospiraceae bacterium]
PSLNIKAAAMGNLICYSSICIIGLIIISKQTGIRIDTVKTIVKPLFAGVVTGVVARFSHIGLVKLIPGRLSTLVSCAIAAAVYVVMVLLFKLVNREELMSLPGGPRIVALLEKMHVLG